MSYPTPSDYQEAVQDPPSAFTDPELKTASPRENVLGLPQPVTGAFAAVFPMTTERGIRYAAKCFLAHVPDQQQRYAAVSRYLSAVDLPWTVAFDYQPRGIHVHGDIYPVLKMEWVEGAGLNRFVGDHLDDRELLSQLAEHWRDVCAGLEEAEIAHGDLQHGNVRVTTDGEKPVVRLVDYDTMYVPELDGETSPEVGHRNYQHPDRTERDFGPRVDRFSALAVYTGLRACAVRPELWQAYDTGENVLFRDGDFYDPDGSPLLAELREDDELAPLADALRTACYLEPEDVPALEDIVRGEASLTAVNVRARPRGRTRIPSARRDPVEQAWAPLLAAVLLGAAAAGHVMEPAYGVVGALAGVIALGVVAGLRYGRHPVVRRRRRLARESERITRLIQNIRRQIDSLSVRRQQVLDSVDERREERLQELREEIIYDHLKHHFIGELRDVEGLTHKHVVRMKSANIRTAYEATAERLGELRRLSDTTRARIAMWRATLVREAEDELPDDLSPAEERRLRRYVDHRVEDIDAEIRRAREKIEVQTREREEVEERRDDLTQLSVGRYIAWLLYLVSLPRRGRRDGPPTPSGTTPARENASGGSAPVPSDGPWWESA